MKSRINQLLPQHECLAKHPEAQGLKHRSSLLTHVPGGGLIWAGLYSSCTLGPSLLHVSPFSLNQASRACCHGDDRRTEGHTQPHKRVTSSLLPTACSHPTGQSRAHGRAQTEGAENHSAPVGGAAKGFFLVFHKTKFLWLYLLFS